MSRRTSSDAICEEFQYLHIHQLLVKEIEKIAATSNELVFDSPLIGRIEKTAEETLKVIIYSDNGFLHRPLFKLPVMLTHWCRKLVINAEEFRLYYNRRIAGSGGYHVVTVETDATYTTMLPSPLNEATQNNRLYNSYRKDCEDAIAPCRSMAELRQRPLWSLIFAKRNANKPYMELARKLASTLDKFNKNFKLAPIQESVSEILFVCFIGNEFLRLVENAELKQSVSVTMQKLNQKCCSLFHEDRWVDMLKQSRESIDLKCEKYKCNDRIEKELSETYNFAANELQALNQYIKDLSIALVDHCGLSIDEYTSDKQMVNLLATSDINYENYFTVIVTDKKIRYLKEKRDKLFPPALRRLKPFDNDSVKLLVEKISQSIKLGSRNRSKLVPVYLYLKTLNPDLDLNQFLAGCAQAQITMKATTFKETVKNKLPLFQTYLETPNDTSVINIKEMIDATNVALNELNMWI